MTYPNLATFFRVIVGGLFALHGLQRVIGVSGSYGVEQWLGRGWAGLIELVCGALVATGLWVAPAAFIAAGEVVVVYYLTHAIRIGWPSQNGSEVALLYCVSFLVLATRTKGR